MLLAARHSNSQHLLRHYIRDYTVRLRKNVFI
eukprot:gene27091-biopygen17649